MAAKKKRDRKRRLHQEPIVREIASMLLDGAPTRWRWTSEARHGLRTAMCLKGMPWIAADKRAEEIVTLARHRIGLSLYPSWIDARGPIPEQREYFFCSNCGGFMPEGNDTPWCGDTCRQVQRQRDWWRAGRQDDRARDRALRVVMTGKGDAVQWQKSERQCRHCGKTFTPKQKVQVTCSHRCGNNIAVAATRACMICASPFAPKRQNSCYCGSKECLAEVNRRKARAHFAEVVAKVHSLKCKVCETSFTSSKSYVAYCGEPCRVEHERRRQRSRTKAAMTTAVSEPATPQGA